MTTMELIERGIGHNCLADAYGLGRADERAEILKMVDWRIDQDIVKRKIDIHIDFAEILTTENVLRIIAEQLKELSNEQIRRNVFK